MSAPLPPLLLRPHYVPKPWGGRRLADELGRSDLPEGPIGESWEVFDLFDDDHPAGSSIVDGGAHDGQSLRSLLRRPFPLLIKVLDAREDLSVQIHPDGEDGGPLKEEAWIALASGGEVAIADAADERPLSQVPPGAWRAYLKKLPLAGVDGAGSTPTVVHIPPGTVHAILAGALLLEVQNPADVTWRLDDYGRPGLDGEPRELHLEEAREQLLRPTPSPARLRTGAECARLDGERFSVALYSGGSARDLPPGVVYLTDAGSVALPGAEAVAVPGHRSVVLPRSGAVVACQGTIIAFAS